jgi:imidazolonepropionase-like amidohydrolase
MLAIQAPLVFDGERMLADGALVLIDSGRIAGVEPRLAPVPDGCAVRVLDGVLLPGLIDAHAHLCADAGPGALERLGETDGTGLAAAGKAASARATTPTCSQSGPTRPPTSPPFCTPRPSTSPVSPSGNWARVR